MLKSLHSTETDVQKAAIRPTIAPGSWDSGQSDRYPYTNKPYTLKLTYSIAIIDGTVEVIPVHLRVS